MSAESMQMAIAEASAHVVMPGIGKPKAVKRTQPVADNAESFRVLTLRDLLSTEFPPRDQLLAPWLTTQSLGMLYAWRGVGKTYAALNIAYAVASGGSWLTWKAERPRKVLYLDGEMPGNLMQERLAQIGMSAAYEPPEGYFRILTPDKQPNGITPNLASEEGRQAVNEMIESDTALIVVDNLSALVRGSGRENDAGSWQCIADWVLPLRAKGHSVLFIHHAGKGGEQRGTSKKEDVLDAVLCLKRPGDYSEKEGARFEIHFDKARGLLGDDVRPIEARLDTDKEGRHSWTWRTVEDAELKRASELKNEGASQADIADEMGLSRFQVARLIKRAASARLVTSASFNKGGKRTIEKSFVEVDDDF